MKTLVSFLFCVAAVQIHAAGLTPIFQDDAHQITGVAITKDGRMFVNYPRWQEPHDYDVVEIVSNTAHPFPDITWNSWRAGESGTDKWVCVQTVFADDRDGLWVVDPAAPKMEKVEGGGAKLVWFDLKTGNVRGNYNLTHLVGDKSYLNDVRVDFSHSTAYMTESKKGGIIIVDINSGSSRLVLARDKSVHCDPKYNFTIEGRPLFRNGKPFKGQSDGIALSPDRQWLYYKPLTDARLYRIATADLRNLALTQNALAKKVEDLGNVCAADGLIFDAKGNLYLTDIGHDRIARFTPGHKLETVVQDERLNWPDTFTWAPDGSLVVSCSQIPTMAWSHNGQSTRITPYTIFKIKE